MLIITMLAVLTCTQVIVLKLDLVVLKPPWIWLMLLTTTSMVITKLGSNMVMVDILVLKQTSI